jgi:phosphatidylserine/phosphatidylglycerophosphate/cardiolipin synthase-like enzyme
MRKIVESKSGKLRACAIAGTRVILIALNIADGDRAGLLGFAFQRKTGDGAFQWLKGMKVFPSLAPKDDDGKKIQYFATNESPVQSFLWSDYTAIPGTKYTFEVSAMYGRPHDLEPKDSVTFDVTTELPDDGRHGIWFNRGAIASQAFADEFGNKSLTDAEYNDPNNKEVAWLSRGLLEACLDYIDKIPSGDALRLCAYEFTYQRFLLTLKKALDRGVDVQIVYHATSANEKAVTAAKLPSGNLFKRTRPKTPHNKFIVHLKAGRNPVSVWTGSTNFTPSGFLGQTNVGHLVTDTEVAKTYLQLWTELAKNPEAAEARDNAMTLSPNPKNLVDENVTLVFSPRPSDRMLDWYGERIADAAASSMFTGAFSVDPEILKPMEQPGPSMRFILLERPPTPEIIKAQEDNPADLLFSYGAILGKMKIGKRAGLDEDGNKVTKWAPIPHFAIEEWFLDEELERKNGDGFVFFIHTKFLLVDALSNDPLVCTGSANFSGASLKSNDENMLLIRGDARVADIYLTEFDRIFRHFYSRDAANEIAREGRKTSFGLLDETDKWTNEYFDSKNAKNHRREMFFVNPSLAWSSKAPNDQDVFIGEAGRPRRGSESGSRSKSGNVKAKPGGEPKRSTKGTRGKKSPATGKRKVSASKSGRRGKITRSKRR